MTERAWIQITSGRGPVECARAVVLLAEQLLRESHAEGLSAEILTVVDGPQAGTAASALLACEGDGARRFAWAQAGQVQWICKSPYRPGHKRKNWFVGVGVVVPPAEDGPLRLDKRELRVETCRASGPGGQNVNKRDTAVRIVHLPTGKSAQAQEERSQARNKALALARLAAQFTDEAAAARDNLRDDLWRAHTALERGDAGRVFRGEKFQPG
ncbi:MAG: peptide chain release factor H [Neomegalonema sp.]|nr:peptide chain release factor H [Neomegalonema sp.]